jgi:hypothetical protein
MFRVGRVAIAIICCGLLAWMAPAVYLSPLEPAWLRSALAALLPAVAVAALFGERPLRRFIVVVCAEFVVVLAAWLSIEPSNERDWQPDVAKIAHAEIQGDRVILHNVRNNEYRSETDYTVRYEDREYDLSKLRSLDLFLIYWGSPSIAHTIMSFGFEDGEYLAISIETRKEKGEDYSALRGFFRQYELVYIVADERDVVRLRTNYRDEEVYVYRLDVPPEGPRLLLQSYLDAINGLYERPQWYNALTDNCTTTIQHLAAKHEQRSWMSWKLVVNGYLDELAYENGAIDQSLPFAELRARSHINERARATDGDSSFSARIRAGVPRMSEDSES